LSGLPRLAAMTATRLGPIPHFRVDKRLEGQLRRAGLRTSAVRRAPNEPEPSFRSRGYLEELRDGVLPGVQAPEGPLTRMLATISDSEGNELGLVQYGPIT
jgi:hypothetical protein